MMFFLSQGYRVIAHDRRGHGRSTQTATGNDMDTLRRRSSRELVQHLDLHDAVHIGHSTGGGEVARYRRSITVKGRVAKAVLISSVPPIMVKTDSEPRRSADRSVRWASRGHAPTNRAAVLSRPYLWPVLWLQPPGCEPSPRVSCR